MVEVIPSYLRVVQWSMRRPYELLTQTQRSEQAKEKRIEGKDSLKGFTVKDLGGLVSIS